jgi:hypothetical protein
MVATALSFVKRKFVSSERVPRTIVSGPFRGIRMNLDLSYQTQIYLGLFERETHPWLKRLSKEITTGNGNRYRRCRRRIHPIFAEKYARLKNLYI